MRCSTASKVVMGAVLGFIAACGGATRVDEAETLQPAAAPADTNTATTFVFGDGSAPRVFCTSCRGPGDCAGDELCVPAADGSGPGLCAPGCTKEGFCASDRHCVSFGAEPGKAPLRACVPFRGCGAEHNGAQGGRTYGAN